MTISKVDENETIPVFEARNLRMVAISGREWLDHYLAKLAVVVCELPESVCDESSETRLARTT